MSTSNNTAVPSTSGEMRFLSLFALLGPACARSVQQDAQLPLFMENVAEEGYKIPTARESILMARKIMHLTTTGNLITTIEDGPALNGDEATAFMRPSGVVGAPIGLLEYYADCEPTSGNPTLLAIDIATPYRNYKAGSNISLAIRWWPVEKTSYLSSWFSPWEEEIPTPHTPAALPRFSLHGRLEEIPKKDLAKGKVPACFLRAHPDSALWQPGNDISHASHYVRFVVEQVYWFGGFGDRARIGWLPIEEWRNVTMQEIIDMPLPGEKKLRSSWFNEWL